MEEKDRKIELPDDDWVVYIPDDAMRAFNSAYFKMLEAQKELKKLREELKIENWKLKIENYVGA